MDDDFEESPVFVNRELRFTNTGEKSTYFDQSNQDYELEIGPRSQWVTDNYYHDMERLISDAPIDLARPVDQPQLIELSWRWHTTSLTQTTRNRLRFGTLHTATQRIQLWGFDVWTEFKSHIPAQDWHRIAPIREELVTDIALDRDFDGARVGYWLAKDDQSRTRPGAWVISVDNVQTQQRCLVIGFRDQIITRSPLKIRQQTAVKTTWQ